MAENVIEAKNISKLYRLGEIGTGTISHDFNRWIARLRGKEDPFAKLGTTNDRTKKAETDYVWALKDIDFEVKQGEVLGIIGRNGAGKSTLLKLLSRVTSPTTGSIQAKGRIASLLEVGTGFHPELTGRENIFLNGAILGMRKHEITRKFSEIVEFAGVEKYVDTPVKRYSSGMYVRLAFAVAAHLESEILIVDEVLAVGDQEFQDKCIGKMNDVAHNDGRTVLFVSHNMAAINRLCKTGILIKNGQIASRGEVNKVIGDYFNEKQNSTSYTDLSDLSGRTGSKDLFFNWGSVGDAQGNLRYEYSIGDDIVFKFSMSAQVVHRVVRMALFLRASDGTKISCMIDADSSYQLYNFDGTATFSVVMKDVRLYPDIYYVGLWVGSIDSNDLFDFCEDCISFKIIDGGKLTTRNLPRSAGLLLLTPVWTRVNNDL